MRPKKQPDRSPEQLIINPAPHLCVCGAEPVLLAANHPVSGKRGYWTVRCQRCNSESLYCKDVYKAVYDWNTKPISQYPLPAFPGVSFSGMRLFEVADWCREEKARLMQLKNDSDRDHLEPEAWRLLSAKLLLLSSLLAACKYREVALETAGNR